MLERTSTGFAAGLILGLVVVGALVGTDTRVHDEAHASAGVTSSEAAAQAFVADWQRMRTGTWTVDSKFIRSNGAGKTLTSDVHEAQRPPERARTTFGQTTIEVPGKTITCAPETNGQKGGCREIPNNGTFDESVRSEVAKIQAFVTGPNRKYAVTQTSKHCYDLQTVVQVAGAWGQSAKFCFDGKTGATISNEIVQSTSSDRITDAVTAVSIREQVQDSDFRQPTA